ncbi:YraN family protein [Candidatus Bipolaricaulota bacterium]|nr:YraN family protein [Candidatus Bipolaricaulota bacterium]
MATPTSDPRHETIDWEAAEERACELLRSEGFEIVARNWRCRSGEIDVIARDGPVLAFIEVKARRSAAYGGPEGAVHRAKQRRIIAAARSFLSTAGCELPIRFDVVTFVGRRSQLYRDAFQAEDGCSPS